MLMDGLPGGLVDHESDEAPVGEALHCEVVVEVADAGVPPRVEDGVRLHAAAVGWLAGKAVLDGDVVAGGAEGRAALAVAHVDPAERPVALEALHVHRLVEQLDHFELLGIQKFI